MAGLFRRAGAELLKLIADVDPAAVANRFFVYTKLVAGVTQLFGRASDGTIFQITPLTGINGRTIIGFGNDNIGAPADTRFLSQWYGGSASVAGTTNVQPIVAPRAGTLKNLFVRHQAAAGNGNSVVYTVMINGVATTMTVTLATGAIGQVSDLVNTAAVAQGDLISFRGVKALGIGGGSVLSQAGLEFA
jgi:hypothetical protein